eukprot:127735-Chlamydomonas_euryale.AAC.2
MGMPVAEAAVAWTGCVGSGLLEPEMDESATVLQAVLQAVLHVNVCVKWKVGSVMLRRRPRLLPCEARAPTLPAALWSNPHVSPHAIHTKAHTPAHT